MTNLCIITDFLVGHVEAEAMIYSHRYRIEKIKNRTR